MILTKEWLDKQGACSDGCCYVEINHIIGMEYSDAIKELIRQGMDEYAGWLIEQKSTVAYVEANGKEISMGAFNVLNPFTGAHTEYATEAEARAAAIELQKKILEIHKVSVSRTVSNENGDSTWTQFEFSSPISIS